MATAGPRYPGTVATEVGPSGDNDWLTPGNVSANDGALAEITAATFDAGDHSYRLKATNFGFDADVPAGSTIDGITVEIERRDSAGDAQDQEVRLYDSTGTLVGDDKQDSVSWPSTNTIATYGGAADMWASGLDADDIRSTGFGVALIALANSANTDIGVDFIRVTVDYTPPAGPTPVTLAVTATLTPVITRQATYQRSLAGTATFTPAVARQLSLLRTLAVTATLTPVVARQVSYLRSLAVTATFAPSLVSGLVFQKLMEVSSAMTAAVTTGLVFGRTLAVESVMAPVVARAATFQQALAATGSWVGSLATEFIQGEGGAVIRRLLLLMGVGR